MLQINNAGVLVTGDIRQMTSDDLEMTFATNTLGTHALTTFMIPVLEQSQHPRVVSTYIDIQLIIAFSHL